MITEESPIADDDYSYDPGKGQGGGPRIDNEMDVDYDVPRPKFINWTDPELNQTSAAKMDANFDGLRRNFAPIKVSHEGTLDYDAAELRIWSVWTANIGGHIAQPLFQYAAPGTALAANHEDTLPLRKADFTSAADTSTTHYFLEGIALGLHTIVLYDPADSSRKDDVKVQVVEVDMDLGTSPDELDELEEEIEGGFVPLNADNDNSIGQPVADRWKANTNNHFPVHYDYEAAMAPIPDEDDLVELHLVANGLPANSELELSIQSTAQSQIKIWERMTKAKPSDPTEAATPLTLPLTIAGPTVDVTYYVEGFIEAGRTGERSS